MFTSIGSFCRRHWQSVPKFPLLDLKLKAPEREAKASMLFGFLFRQQIRWMACVRKELSRRRKFDCMLVERYTKYLNDAILPASNSTKLILDKIMQSEIRTYEIRQERITLEIITKNQIRLIALKEIMWQHRGFRIKQSRQAAKTLKIREAANEAAQGRIELKKILATHQWDAGTSEKWMFDLKELPSVLIRENSGTPNRLVPHFISHRGMGFVALSAMMEDPDLGADFCVFKSIIEHKHLSDLSTVFAFVKSGMAVSSTHMQEALVSIELYRQFLPDALAYLSPTVLLIEFAQKLPERLFGLKVVWRNYPNGLVLQFRPVWDGFEWVLVVEEFEDLWYGSWIFRLKLWNKPQTCEEPTLHGQEMLDFQRAAGDIPVIRRPSNMLNIPTRSMQVNRMIRSHETPAQKAYRLWEAKAFQESRQMALVNSPMYQAMLNNQVQTFIPNPQNIPLPQSRSSSPNLIDLDLDIESRSLDGTFVTDPLGFEDGSCLDWDESHAPDSGLFSNEIGLGSWGNTMDPFMPMTTQIINCNRCGEALGRKARLTCQTLCGECRQKDNQKAPTTEVRIYCRGCRFKVNPIDHRKRCSHQFDEGINWDNRHQFGSSSSILDVDDLNQITLDDYLSNKPNSTPVIAAHPPRQRINDFDLSYEDVSSFNEKWKETALITEAKGKSAARYNDKFKPKKNASENAPKTSKKNKKLSKKEEEKQAALAEAGNSQKGKK